MYIESLVMQNAACSDSKCDTISHNTSNVRVLFKRVFITLQMEILLKTLLHNPVEVNFVKLKL